MYDHDKNQSPIWLSKAIISISLGLGVLISLSTVTSCSATIPPQPGIEGGDLTHLSKSGIEPTTSSTSTRTHPTLEAPPSPTAVSTSSPQQTPVPLPSFDNPANNSFIEEAAAWDAEFVRFDIENTGIWQFPENSFAHPIALEIEQDTAFLLDGGRVIAIDLNNNRPAQTLLEPGATIDAVQVLEPLDLTLSGDSLFVLDRAGDVYRYDLNSNVWQLDRYDRPVEETSGHYFVAIDGIKPINAQEVGNTFQRALLETNYMFVMLYGADTTPLWNLPEGRSVDLSILNDEVFVLQRAIHETTGYLTKYQDTRHIKTFDPKIEIDQPLQIVAADSTLLILDQDGRRLRAINPENGALLKVFQVPQQDQVSTFAVIDDQKLVLAGQDRLYFFEYPDRLAVINDDGLTKGEVQPHDPTFLASLDNYSVPIGGSNITFRDFQLPGAPRHYRLGIHHGIDFYWQPGTKVLAAADGVVTRADVDYIPPTALQLSTWWAESQEQGYTSKETLDNYLGRQVLIEHKDGLVSRYAHLSSIAPGINKGTQVVQGQVIGEVGNSGSPSSLESDNADAHLHFEMWIGENYLGQYLRPIEIREWVERILAN